MNKLLQKIFLLFSSLTTFIAFLLVLFIGFKVLEFVVLPLIVFWLIVAMISGLFQRLFGRKEKMTENTYQEINRQEIVDIPPEDFHVHNL